MSLINQVINDLESREAFTTKCETGVFSGLSSATGVQPKGNFFSIRSLTFIMLVFALITVTYALIGNEVEQHSLGITEVTKSETLMSKEDIYQDSHDSFSEGTRYLSSSENTEILLPAESNLKLDLFLSPLKTMVTGGMPDKNKTIIRNIDFKMSEDSILLNLELEAQVDYRAYTLSEPNRIVVEIDAAVFDGALPELEDQYGISRIRIRQEDTGKLLLVLETNHVYSITDMQLAQDNGNYSLALSMLPEPIEERGILDNYADVQIVRNESYPENANYGEMEKNIRSDRELDSSRRLYIEAQELYRLGKVYSANELLQTLLNQNAEYNSARTLLAQKLIEQGQLSKAEQVLKTGLTVKHVEPVWTNLYARLLVNKGEIKAAISVLTSVMPDVQHEPEYYAFLAAIYQKNEQHREAITTYRHVLESRPHNSVWWMGLAISLESMQLDRDALYAYNRALQGEKMSQELRQYVNGKIIYLNKRV